MQVDIGLLKKEDCGELEDFLALVFGDDVRKMAREAIDVMFSAEYNRQDFIVVKLNGKIIGCGGVSEEMFSVKTWGISWIAVHPDFRNKGIGQKAVQACLDEIAARANSTVTALLATYPGKTKLYERLGFKGGTIDHEGGSYMARIVEPVSQAS